MAAGEAIDFGIDSMAVPFLKEAGVLFAFYTAGAIAMAYLALFHIDETKYFTEEEVTIPKHVEEEHAHAVVIEGKALQRRESHAEKSQSATNAEKVVELDA